MKYLKKYQLFLEEDEFEIKDTDKEDVKLSKDKLNLLKKHLTEYQSKKQAIDEIYKNSQNLEETGEKIKTILGEESEERNPFLVDYNNIARITKEIDIIHKELVQDKLRADDFREESTLVKDSETKAAIVGKLTDVQNRIAEKNKKIVDKQKEIQELTTEHQEKMSQMKEDMEEYIKKISETEKK